MPANPTTDQNETSENLFVATLPEWKISLWHDISLAAQDKSAFEEDDYDKNGDLNPRSTKFEELCTWLVCSFHFHLQGSISRKTSCYVLTNMLTECASSQGSIRGSLASMAFRSPWPLGADILCR
jgi:hypothetical protein